MCPALGIDLTILHTLTRTYIFQNELEFSLPLTRKAMHLKSKGGIINYLSINQATDCDRGLHLTNPA